MPPEWTWILKVMAQPCTTQQVWGVRRDDGDVDCEKSALSSTGLLHEIHRPDPAGNEASEDWHRHFAYNAQGQIIGERLLVIGGETEVFIGRVMEYDMQGRTRRDAVVEGEGSLPDDARALEWDYDVAGQLVSARTRDENEYVLNEVRFQYDGYGQAVNVWENHTDEVDTDGSFKVTTNYSAPAVQGARYVGRRPTSRTVNVNAQSPHYPLEVTLGYQPNTPSDFLCRAASHIWNHWDIAGEPDCFLRYRTVEGFAGTNRWQSTEGYRQYRGDCGPEEQPSLDQSIDAYDGFLRPAAFTCQQGYDPRPIPPEHVPLSLTRNYTREAASARLSAISDSFLDDSVTLPDPLTPELAGRTATFNGFGEATAFTSTITGRPTTTHGWRHDAAGNWKCFSGDFTEPPSSLPERSRCYDRRNEIFQIDEVNPDCGALPDGRIQYDEAGRVIRHHYDPHGVSQKFFYDAWGRLAGYGPDTPDVRYRYDALGRLIRREGSYADYYYGPGCELLCACLSINGNYPQYYIRSFSSRRLLALHDGSYTGCSWYIVDALGEMYGLCDFEVTGSAYQRYRYSVKGSLDETVETPTSGYHTIIVYAGTAFGTESIRQGATEALNEGAAQISVGVGCGPFVFGHMVGATLQAAQVPPSLPKRGLRIIVYPEEPPPLTMENAGQSFSPGHLLDVALHNTGFVGGIPEAIKFSRAVKAYADAKCRIPALQPCVSVPIPFYGGDKGLRLPAATRPDSFFLTHDPSPGWSRVIDAAKNATDCVSVIEFAGHGAPGWQQVSWSLVKGGLQTADYDYLEGIDYLNVVEYFSELRSYFCKDKCHIQYDGCFTGADRRHESKRDGHIHRIKGWGEAFQIMTSQATGGCEVTAGTDINTFSASGDLRWGRQPRHRNERSPWPDLEDEQE